MAAGIASRAAIDGEERIRAEVVSEVAVHYLSMALDPALACDCGQAESCVLVDTCGLEYAAAAGFKQHPKPSGPTPPLEAFEQQWQVAGVGRAKLAPARCLSEGSIKMDM